MPVTLQARDVRAAIYQAAGASPSTILLSGLFNEVFAALVGADATLNFHAAIDEAEPEIDEWRSALVKHAYQNLVGPRLRRRQVDLHHVTDQVLIFWDAMQEMSQWLAEQLWRLRERGDDGLSSADSIRIGRQLTWKIREPAWTDAVYLTSVADSIWRIPDTQQWRAVELTTVTTSPEADLALACLYHQLLQSDSVAGSLALVCFEPHRRERLFSPTEIAEALPKLKNLIGRLAGASPIDN